MSILGNDLLLGSGDEGYNLTRSLRTRASASASLSRTPASAGNRKTWTWSAWVKRGALSSNQVLFISKPSATSDATFTTIGFSSSNTLLVSGYSVQWRNTTQVFRDPSAWYHIVVTWDTTQATAANRVKVYVNGSQVTAFGTTFDPSLNFDGAINQADAHYFCYPDGYSYSYFDGYLTEVNFVDGQGLTPSSFGETDTTTGVWKPKRYAGTYGTNGFYLPFSTVGGSTYAASFNGSNQSLYGTLASSIGTGNFTVEMWVNPTTLSNYNSWFGITRGAGGFNVGTDAAGTLVFYSSSARQIDVAGVIAAGRYTHIAFVRNGTTLKGYVNGVAVATATVSTNFSATTFYIGSLDNSVEFNNGLISNLRVTNTAVYTANFTPPSVALTAVSGTMLLTLQSSTIVDNSGNAITINNVNSVSTSTAYPFVVTLGSDASGNNNNWATNNISLTPGTTYDSMTDVPTLTNATAANFAVLNPLLTPTYAGSGLTIADGNLKVSSAGSSQNCGFSTIGASSGKFYCEITTSPLGADARLGVFKTPLTTGYFYTALTDIMYGSDGNVRQGETTVIATYNSYTTGDVIGIALDMDSGKVFFSKNGTWQGSSNPATGTNPAYTGLTGTYILGGGTGGGGGVMIANFGQRPFSYTPPTGFVALNTYNLPTSTIVKGNTVMDATLWTGNGATQTITNAAGFKPDLVWGKSRSTAIGNALYDSVRGVTKWLSSDSTAAEATYSGVTSFNSNGFSVGSSSDLNNNASTFVGWQWQAGQGTTSTNTNGTITSTVSVNASAGFSVVTYTGTGANATVGHGLGVAPSLIICKSRGAATNWGVWHASLTSYSYFLLLNSTAAQATAANTLQALPTSTLVSLGASSIFNDASTMVAYCFAPIAGYSAFGSYTGNGSTDGPFIYTGFRPKFLMIKSSTYSGADSNWNIIDTARNTYNVSTAYLNADSSSAEGSYAGWDLLSNGFKLRNVGGSLNSSGQTYIYMAFAETPTKFALAR